MSLVQLLEWWVLPGLSLVFVFLGLIWLAWRQRSFQQRLDFYEGLLRNARIETRVANQRSVETERLLNSALNGEEARRIVQGQGQPVPGSLSVSPSVEPIARELLEHRIRYRQAAGQLDADKLSYFTRENSDGETS